MDDHFLTNFQQQPPKEFSERLYQRINRPMRTQTVTFQRLSLTFAGIALAAALILAASPSARAFAASIIRQIGMVTLIDRTEETIRQVPETSAASPTALPPQAGDVKTAQTADQASRIAGFGVLAPTYLPEGLAAQSAWQITPLGTGTNVFVRYAYEDNGTFLEFNQALPGKGETYSQSYGPNETVTDITVRGQKGVWIIGRLLVDPKATLIETNWLMWAEDGITYTLMSDALSLEEMLNVAESLQE